MLHAQLVFIAKVVIVNHVQLIVLSVNQKMFVKLVLKVSRLNLCNMEVINFLIVLKSVVMVKDSNLIVMMVTRTVVMVVHVNARLKRDGLVQVDLVLNLVLVYLMLLLELM